MKNLELLSPVGNFESLKCAINNGANAVYLGLNNFNARGNIDNFDFSSLAEGVKLAHLYNVKVYLTLNTLASDDEFDSVAQYVKKALVCRVDAFIVQDIGLIYFLRQNFPNIELHASTQMGINNLEGIENISDLSLTRVVLARETPLSEIKRIKDNTKIDIEYFVQGALCVSFSGNCYLCSLLADASGNRGKCKQFCRLPFSLNFEKTKKEGYLISTKDFCMLSFLQELALSGVTSFKIEGRARRPAYVATVTGVYRKVIDNNFKFDDNDILALKNVYNRGNYISGYFNDERVIYSKSQNHIGVEIGKILNVKTGKRFNEVTIKSSHNLQKGDLLKIFSGGKEIGVLSVVDFKKISNNEYILTSTSTFPKNSKVNLIVNSQMEEKYLNNKKYIEVDVKLYLQPNQNAKMILSSEFGQKELTSEIIPQEAKSRPISKEEITNQFAKTGENFRLRNLEVEGENIFLTKAQLNSLRREGLEKLEEEILKNYEKREKIMEKSQFLPKNIEIFDKKQDLEGIIELDDLSKTTLIEGKTYIYNPSDFDDNILEDYKRYGKYQIFLSLPIMATKNEIEKLKMILSKCSNWGVVANNYYALSLTSKDKTIIGSNMNVYNSYAVKYYQEKGYKNIILSIENHPFIRNCGVNLYCYTKFYPQYMYFRHCPYKEHLNSTCSKCTYKKGLIYKLNNRTFALKRQKILSCQFILKSTNREERVGQQNAGEIQEV